MDSSSCLAQLSMSPLGLNPKAILTKLTTINHLHSCVIQPRVVGEKRILLFIRKL